jgi:hypothetical protein
MIVEHIELHDVVRCERCRTFAPGWTATLHETDQGQHVYSIRINLTVSLCYACTPKEPYT